MSHGIDACGAGLFCAAFDGRTQATCYLENTRQPNEECIEDRNCSTQSCNTEAKACRALPGMPCTSEVSCFDPSNQESYACVDQTCTPTQGNENDPCDVDEHCAQGLVCSQNRCLPSDGRGFGQTCTRDEECEARYACLEGVCFTDTERNLNDPCNQSAQCDGRFVCIDGTCSQDPGPVSCRRDSECPEGIPCDDGQCGCQEGFARCGSVCTAYTDECANWGDCFESEQCSDGFWCHRSQCRYAGDSEHGTPCQIDAECAVSHLCLDGPQQGTICTKICTANVNCPGATVCTGEAPDGSRFCQ